MQVTRPDAIYFKIWKETEQERKKNSELASDTLTHASLQFILFIFFFMENSCHEISGKNAFDDCITWTSKGENAKSIALALAIIDRSITSKHHSSSNEKSEFQI